MTTTKVFRKDLAVAVTIRTRFLGDECSNQWAVCNCVVAVTLTIELELLQTAYFETSVLDPS